MLQIGFNTGEAFDKEYQANDSTKYIFETVSTAFIADILPHIKKNKATLELIKDDLMDVDESYVSIAEKQLKERYETDLKFVKIHDVQCSHRKFYYFYVFRTVKPMTVKEFIDYFEPDGLCYVYYPCEVVKIFEND